MSHADQLALAVRYVSSDGMPCEKDFLTSFHQLVIKQNICLNINELEKLNIHIDDCRGHSYNNT